MLELFGVFSIGFVVGILIAWLFMPASSAFALSRPVVLNPEQTTKLNAIRTSLISGIDTELAELCKARQDIITEIKEFQPDKYAPQFYNCTALKQMTAEQISTMILQPIGHIYSTNVTVVIHAIIKLYLEKALTVYCAGAEFDINLFKLHMIRGVDDICSPNSDLRQVLINVADYILLKPLSAMS